MQRPIGEPLIFRCECLTFIFIYKQSFWQNVAGISGMIHCAISCRWYWQQYFNQSWALRGHQPWRRGGEQYSGLVAEQMRNVREHMRNVYWAWLMINFSTWNQSWVLAISYFNRLGSLERLCEWICDYMDIENIHFIPKKIPVYTTIREHRWRKNFPQYRSYSRWCIECV